jgi:magnesium chelatase family protein
MLATVISAAVLGVDAYRVDVEVDLAWGLPNFATVGLAEGAVKESRVRVESALKNSGFDFPQRRITVNLAPANIRKAGSAFDLPIALGLVSSTEFLSKSLLKSTLVVGELGLDGEIRKIPGALSMAVMAKELGISQMICPKQNAAEAGVVGGVEVFPVGHFGQVVEHFTGRIPLEPIEIDQQDALQSVIQHNVDFSEVKGQVHVKRALEVAAAGGHNLLMLGPPGSGKTMLARRLSTILPPLTFAEAIETTKVYSIMGLIRPGSALIGVRPFRAPHHTVSDAGLVGGGSVPKPGEVSLAHNGVLFLDEMPEFRRHVLEVLRQPLEDSMVTIARAQMSVTFPANIMLVAAMNPCPCGYLTEPEKVCLCSEQAIHRYRNRVSGPLLDRIDIQVEVPAVPYREMMDSSAGDPSEVVRKRVIKARQIQQRRYKDVVGVRCNAQMPPTTAQKICRPNLENKRMIEQAVKRLGLSARAVIRVFKVARTIADLEGESEVGPTHIAEAIQYRSLDRAVSTAIASQCQTLNVI